MGTWANSEDPDEMQHNAAFHQGLHCMLRLNNLQGQKYIIIYKFYLWPLELLNGSPMLIVAICIGKSVRIQGVNCKLKTLPKVSSATIFPFNKGFILICMQVV